MKVSKCACAIQACVLCVYKFLKSFIFLPLFELDQVFQNINENTMNVASRLLVLRYFVNSCSPDNLVNMSPGLVVYLYLNEN